MLIDSFLKYLRLERNYSDKTVVAYGVDLRKFEEFFKDLDEELDFTTIDADVVRQWVVSLMDEEHVKASSVNRKLSSLRSFYRFLLRKKEITVNPMLRVVGPKKDKPLPTFLRETDMNRLLDESSFGEGFEACRDRMILEMFYATGMRLSELIGLNEADVDFLYAGIMPVLSEAAGMARAMSETGLPYIISFTVQQNGSFITFI